MGQQFSGLFEIYQREPHSFKSDVKKVKAWLQSGKRQFSLSVAISLMLHVFLIGFVAVSQYSRHRHSREIGLIDIRPIINALSRIKTEPSSPTVTPRLISPTEEKEITQLLTKTPLFDTRFSEEERTELAKKLMEGYFQLKSRGSPFWDTAENFALRTDRAGQRKGGVRSGTIAGNLFTRPVFRPSRARFLQNR